MSDAKLGLWNPLARQQFQETHCCRINGSIAPFWAFTCQLLLPWLGTLAKHTRRTRCTMRSWLSACKCSSAHAATGIPGQGAGLQRHQKRPQQRDTTKGYWREAGSETQQKNKTIKHWQPAGLRLCFGTTIHSAAAGVVAAAENTVASPGTCRTCSCTAPYPFRRRATAVAVTA